jgi:arylsulfatase A-like enzyme
MIFAIDPSEEEVPAPGMYPKTPGAWARSPLYEEVAAIPLTIYVPGIPPATYRGLTSAVDLMPTVLDLMGSEIPSRVEGHSLLPKMRDPALPGREYVITACPFMNAGDKDQLVDHIERKCVTPSMATVTTDDWSLVYDVEPGGSELYNLTADAGQEKNLIGRHRDVARELHRRLVDFMRQTRVPQRLLDPRLELRL